MLRVRNGNVYGYRVYRDSDGRVRHAYVGAGDLAVVAEELAESDRALRTILAASERARRAGADRRLDRADREASKAIAAALDAAASVMRRRGYHRHDGGSWRRRRGFAVDDATTGELTKAETRKLGTLRKWAAPLASLAKAGNGSDEGAALALAEAFRDDPAGYIRVLGIDFADLVKSTMIKGELSAERRLSRDVASFDARRVAAELAGDDPSPAVALLAEAAALARLDWLLSMLPAEGSAGAVERRRTKAHGRYLRTLVALAKVKRVERPTGPAVVAVAGVQQVVVGSTD
jgi:hypothetical protein